MNRNLYTIIFCMDVLSDGRIAQVSIAQVKKNRAWRALRSGLDDLNGGITRRMRRLNRSSEGST